MRSAMRLTMPLLAMLACGACASSIRVTTPDAGCSTLVPAGWNEPIPPAAFPADVANVRDGQVYGVQSSGQLLIANARTSDVIGIVRACEAPRSGVPLRDRAALVHSAVAGLAGPVECPDPAPCVRPAKCQRQSPRS